VLRHEEQIDRDKKILRIWQEVKKRASESVRERERERERERGRGRGRKERIKEICHM
jgi:hypothetical protein